MTEPDEKWLGISIWSPFWPRVIATCQVGSALLLVLAVVLGIFGK